MNLLRIIQRSEAPPDGFIYVDKDTGHRVHAWDKVTMLRLAKDYRRVNNLPIAEDFDEQAIHQLCTTLPPEWCRWSDGGKPSDFIDVRLNVTDVLRGTLALAEVFARRIASTILPSLFPYVAQEEAEARAATCASCYVKVSIEGCASCSELFPAIAQIIGDRRTKSDQALIGKACAICKCSAIAQVHIRKEILARGVTEDQRVKFKAVPHCWKSVALSEVKLDETPEPE